MIFLRDFLGYDCTRRYRGFQKAPPTDSEVATGATVNGGLGEVRPEDLFIVEGSAAGGVVEAEARKKLTTKTKQEWSTNCQIAAANMGS